ncbi:hypothetical protein AC630_37580 [Bradyrhizobium sp. AS23.2]|nr:hypothetical protein AC630_37580 [Bradyrhizobium sp. AS23.2]
MVPRNPSSGLGDITQQFDIKVIAEGVEPITGVRDRKDLPRLQFTPNQQVSEEIIPMKAIVVTDETAGTAGMKLVERPEPQAAINDVVVRVHVERSMSIWLLSMIPLSE